MAALAAKEQARRRRHRGVSKRVRGTPERPRLSVFRSASHIYAQVIDDAAGRTLAAASTMDKQLRGQSARGGNKAAAYEVGKLLGQRAVAAGVARVVFDRNGYLYHGRVAALAQGAREAGLEF